MVEELHDEWDAFRAALGALPANKEVMVDLGNVDYLSKLAVQEFIKVRGRLQKPFRLALVNPSPDVAESLRIMRLHEIFELISVDSLMTEHEEY